MKTKDNKADQMDRFHKTARELDCDEDEAAFDEKLRVIARQKPRQQTQRQETKEWIGFAILYGGELILCLASAVLICQAYVWIRKGTWPALSIATTWQVLSGSPFPAIGWSSIGSALIWLSQQADSVVLLIVSFGLVMAGSMLRR